MKNRQIVSGGVLWGILFGISLGASAAAPQSSLGAIKTFNKGYYKEPKQEVTYSQAAARSDHGGTTFSAGFSTLTGPMVGLAPGALTLLLNVSPHDAFQFFFGVPSTTGGLSMGGSFLYKRTLIGDEHVGVHVGAGFGLGSLTGNFVISFGGVGGFHFELPGLSQIQFHLDGGPAFTITNSTTTSTNFTLGALSPALGASVMYMF